MKTHKKILCRWVLSLFIFSWYPGYHVSTYFLCKGKLIFFMTVLSIFILYICLSQGASLSILYILVLLSFIVFGFFFVCEYYYIFLFIRDICTPDFCYHCRVGLSNRAYIGGVFSFFIYRPLFFTSATVIFVIVHSQCFRIFPYIPSFKGIISCVCMFYIFCFFCQMSCVFFALLATQSSCWGTCSRVYRASGSVIKNRWFRSTSNVKPSKKNQFVYIILIIYWCGSQNNCVFYSNRSKMFDRFFICQPYDSICCSIRYFIRYNY